MLRATVRGLLSRKLRLLLSGLAVVLAVVFTAGALVLNDTLGRSFDRLFAGAYDGIEVQRQSLDLITNLLLGFAAVAVLVGVLLIHNTFSIILAQRTGELALMRALGASRRQVVGSVLLEAFAVGVVASSLGLAVGIGIASVAAGILADRAGDVTLGVPPSAVIAAFAVGTGVTMLSALGPALRASRVPPIAGMRETVVAERPMLRLAIGGGLVTAVGGGLLGWALFGQPSPSGTLAGALVTFAGVALLTPLFSRPVVGLLGRAFSGSVPGQLGQLNSRRDPRRTAVIAAALMIGVALVTAVSTVVASMSTSVENVVGTNLDSDLIVYGESTAELPTTVDPATVERIRALRAVDLVTASASDRALINGEERHVAAWDDHGAANLMLSRRAVAGDIDGLAPGELVLNETRAKDLGISVGGRLTVELAAGAREYRVRGIFKDAGVADAITLPWTDAQAAFQVKQASSVYVKLAPGTPPGDAKRQVGELLRDHPEINVQTRDEAVDSVRRVFDLILDAVRALLGIAMAIAVLGIANTLALSVLERTRELGLLRAIGLLRGQTMRMIAVEAVVISLFGALLGVVVGAGLGAAMVRALRDEGVDQLTLPWSQMLTYLAAAALVGVLAAIAPALRAARLDVLDAIAYE